MTLTLKAAVARFGEAAKTKLANLAVTGEAEEQLRSPFEVLLHDMAELCSLPRGAVACVGESAIADLKTRPDYAVTMRDTLVGFVELKAPRKGADPRRYRGHDKEQWEKLQSLPNLIYSDGNEFSLWQDDELVAHVHVDGDIETSGAKLSASGELVRLFDHFLRWSPSPPRDAKELARQSARLCRFLRDEVLEQLEAGSKVLTSLETGWRKMLFPEATDAQFADGYAQAVTFGLLVARAREIPLRDGIEQAARELGATNSLIGAALRIVTQEVESETILKTSLATLTRVLDVVEWQAISKGNADAWLYFYEDFLEVYDNALRKKTGSYYTPPEVVGAMVRLVAEILRSPERFGLSRGLASNKVTIADPAVGTGTFALGVLRHIAEAVEASEGEGAVPGAVNAALNRLIAFEMQLGPFAVAQLRILAEVKTLTRGASTVAPRMFVTDTLGNPNIEEEWLPNTYAPIAESRRQANEIKKNEPITVVIGNPPYKDKAKGLGGWVEQELLRRWLPPREWGVGAHAKHLRNLYVYFWRWATYKVFEHDPNADSGVVCFITVAGFLNGDGFQGMRDYLRRHADEIWVIDCSPEGHQPDVPTRIFQDVQQPVCIVLASRVKRDDETPAVVRFRALPKGPREEKFASLAAIELNDEHWVECPSDWRASFLPASAGAWSAFPALDDFFVYNGSGVMPGRTWVIAPDADSLERRWNTLIHAPANDKEDLFYPHLRRGELGDKHTMKAVKAGLAGYEVRTIPVAKDHGAVIEPVRYAFRSFDRQWIIPDNRLINQPNPQLWEWYSERQVHLTALARTSPRSGPAITFAGLITDLDHYKGSFGGRVFPLWCEAGESNIRPALLTFLSRQYNVRVDSKDVMAYIAGIAAHPAFTRRFNRNLVQPGLRIPLPADAGLFQEAVELGRRVIWLHTYGERFTSPQEGRPKGPPRLPKGRAPRIPSQGAIPDTPNAMPETIAYDPARQRLLIGDGYVEPVPAAVWEYEVSGKQVLRQWFSYRQKNRERPVMGDRRPPSKLEEVKADHWLAEYTSDLIDLLNVLGLLVELEPEQADLLDRICAGTLIGLSELDNAKALELPPRRRRKPSDKRQMNFLDGQD
ncbi:MAG: N-6 DNA methylase [Planctomycetota bacterium]|nr:N-6 DNA methylase [Planctomycetota bacterium]